MTAKSKQKDCLRIVKEYLEKNGFDGLWNPFGECACEISELMPCDGNCAECRPGYKVIPPEGEYHSWDFYICASKDDKPWEDE